MLSKEITDKEKRLILEDGWTVSINDTQYEDVILEELHFKPMNKGDNGLISWYHDSEDGRAWKDAFD